MTKMKINQAIFSVTFFLFSIFPIAFGNVGDEVSNDKFETNPRLLQQKLSCNFQCPQNSVRKPNRQCYDNFDDCECVPGFHKQGSRCVPTSGGGNDCNFQCAINSARKPNRQCYDNFDDCECVPGFEKKGNECVPIGGDNRKECGVIGDVSVLTDTTEIIDLFNDNLFQFIEGNLVGPNFGPSSVDADDFLTGVNLFTEGLAFSVFPLGPQLSFAISTLGFILGLGQEDRSREILNELGQINNRLDEIEELLIEGFATVVNEIILNDARGVLQEKLELLSDMEISFKRFTAAGQSEGARELREREFRDACNVQGDRPYQLFRTLYGHACKDCDALDGGGRDLNAFIEVFKTAAIKPALGDLKDGERFRKSFSSIMLSLLSRAIIMHTVCLPAIDVDLCDDPFWLQELKQMAFGLEEVALNLVETEEELMENARLELDINCRLKLTRMCATNRRDGSGIGLGIKNDARFSVKLDQEDGSRRIPLTRNRFLDMSNAVCVDVNTEISVDGFDSLEASQLRIRLEEADSGIFNSNDVAFINHGQPCLADNLDGIVHTTSEGRFSFFFEKFDPSLGRFV